MNTRQYVLIAVATGMAAFAVSVGTGRGGSGHGPGSPKASPSPKGGVATRKAQAGVCGPKGSGFPLELVDKTPFKSREELTAFLQRSPKQVAALELAMRRELEPAADRARSCFDRHGLSSKKVLVAFELDATPDEFVLSKAVFAPTSETVQILPAAARPCLEELTKARYSGRKKQAFISYRGAYPARI